MALEITTSKLKIDRIYVHRYLSEQSYWARDRTLASVKRSIENSLCFSVLYDKKQVGFARVISDEATFAYLADVFIDKQHQGKGFAKKLMKAIMNEPKLQGVEKWMLKTRDAQELYIKFGFAVSSRPEWVMEMHNQLTTIGQPKKKSD